MMYIALFAARSDWQSSDVVFVADAVLLKFGCLPCVLCGLFLQLTVLVHLLWTRMSRDALLCCAVEYSCLLGKWVSRLAAVRIDILKCFVPPSNSLTAHGVVYCALYAVFTCLDVRVQSIKPQKDLAELNFTLLPIGSAGRTIIHNSS